MAGVRPTHSASPLDELLVSSLGTVAYRDALAIQAEVQAKRQADEQPDTLLLLEHPPIYTRGRRARDDELSLGEDFYRAHGIEIVPTDRGGKVTYHGPGQLVGYPIMRVTDIGAHLRKMEAAIVAALPSTASRRAHAATRASTTPACGWPIARSPRSACTSRAACPHMGLP